MAVDNKNIKCRPRNIVTAMTTIHAQSQIENLYSRLRLIRESRHLTLARQQNFRRGKYQLSPWVPMNEAIDQ